ncbi:uncharacterized protein LOC127616503 isoform X2 [Hippocampus zosterae]|uniref:uncharacterized protein LOC127616503 isoform X2 n=1 Tax=Hippocampus zosterae TaxID=109293 RepID=UPI00223E20AD|nr:uncharacterized protein LOC127616503 isoform X2 [Hippocampus zosterae]
MERERMAWHQYAPSAVFLHILPCIALVQCPPNTHTHNLASATADSHAHPVPNRGWSSASSAVEPRRAMEEPAAQHRRVDGSWRGRQDGGKAAWKNESSISSLLKHSCLLCWSSPRQADVAETDERVLGKSSEIRELENAVTVENLELQEQQSDRKELEETLLKLAKHKEKLIQQIKEIRQLCYEESQQILSLQAEEVQRESQVEEYERELARARWRLRKLKEEVKQAKRKMEEAGERNCPLQDSIRQSYEEILQEEHTLCSVSGGAVTPESQLDDSTSPADTAEDEPLPMRPWGRSQSLPAYADLIMVANGAPFCNNLADTREEVDDSSSSSPKMDRSNLEDDPEDVEEEGGVEEASVLTKLDFYQADPFAHCDAGHELFHEDLFLTTDASDGFASDPFKGSDPFAADVLFPEPNVTGDEVCDEVGTGPPGAENKSSAGTQCFESEFPDEESDFEIGDSPEDLEAAPEADDRSGFFQPIRSSSEELGPGPDPSWRSRGHCSVESDPNGYELDLGAVSPPSHIQERDRASPAGEFEAAAQVEGGNGAPELVAEALLGPGGNDRARPLDADPEGAAHWSSDIQEEQPGSPADSPRFPDSGPESPDTDLNLDYEPTSRSSFDPYGFKLSPEHSSRSLFDPDETELSPLSGDQDLSFDPERCSGRAEPLSFYAYEMASSRAAPGSDPYGFKLSLEEENQEVPEPCGHDSTEDAAPPGGSDEKDKGEALKSSDREALWLLPCENQEVLDLRGDDRKEPSRAFQSANREGPQSSSLVTGENVKSVGAENRDFLNLCSSPENQEVVDFLSDREVDRRDADNQQVLDFCRRRDPRPLDLTRTENREVLDSDGRGDEEAGENGRVLLFGGRGNRATPTRDGRGDDEPLDSDDHDNQEVPDPTVDGPGAESDDDRRILKPESKSSASDSSSDGDAASEEPLGGRPADDPCHGSVPRGDLALAFGAGGYVGCPDVAEDLRPLRRRHARVGAPVRPPRPSLRAKEKAESPTQGIDLK